MSKQRIETLHDIDYAKERVLASPLHGLNKIDESLLFDDPNEIEEVDERASD